MELITLILVSLYAHYQESDTKTNWNVVIVINVINNTCGFPTPTFPTLELRQFQVYFGFHLIHLIVMQ